ncbi:hypothetical protein [Parafrankia elaeagni]|uniref:hypothetical protein n=1 Tax=Parafrankia elaeagni TaxID=222534 RepID=UPI0004771B10|nr:hypothetical protein [Parafrankia elaeagni]
MQRHAGGRQGRPHRFTITVPDSWFVLDTQTARSATAIARMVTARAHDHPVLVGQEPTIARILRDVAARADRHRAAYCAVMVEDVRGDGLSAWVMVCLRPTSQHIPDLPRQERPAGADRPARAGGTAREARAAQDGRPIRRTGPADRPDHPGDPDHPDLRRWRRVGAVHLPAAGLATRTVRVEPQRSTDGEETFQLVMRTTVPVPGVDRVAVIACASPNTALAAALHDLFDAVTATFGFVHEQP